jgi:hypothetical protein
VFQSGGHKKPASIYTAPVTPPVAPLRGAPVLKNPVVPGDDEISPAFKSPNIESPNQDDRGVNQNGAKDHKMPGDGHKLESEEGEDGVAVIETPAKTPWRSSHQIGGLQASTIKRPPSPTGSTTPSVATSIRSTSKRPFVPHGEALLALMFAHDFPPGRTSSFTCCS